MISKVKFKTIYQFAWVTNLLCKIFNYRLRLFCPIMPQISQFLLGSLEIVYTLFQHEGEKTLTEWRLWCVQHSNCVFFLLATTDARGQKSVRKTWEKPCKPAGESPTTYAGALHQPRREEDDPFTCRCIVARACVRVFRPFDPRAPFRNRYHGRLQVALGYRLSRRSCTAAHAWIIIMYCAMRLSALYKDVLIYRTTITEETFDWLMISQYSRSQPAILILIRENCCLLYDDITFFVVKYEVYSLKWGKGIFKTFVKP